MSLSVQEIAKMMDLSCVRADSAIEEIEQAAVAAIKYGCICVFSLPAHTSYLASLLKDNPEILIGGVVGFPDGGATTRSKVQEAIEQIELGAGELDMVLNIAWLKAAQYDKVEEDIKKVVEAAGKVPVKVIFECHYLNDEEIVKACEISIKAGATFVKTGTGWAETGATLENVKLMSDTVGSRCKVKAAGGVKDKETLLEMNKRGATRFGIGVRTALAILGGEGSADEAY